MEILIKLFEYLIFTGKKEILILDDTQHNLLCAWKCFYLAQIQLDYMYIMLFSQPMKSSLK